MITFRARKAQYDIWTAANTLSNIQRVAYEALANKPLLQQTVTQIILR